MTNYTCSVCGLNVKLEQDEEQNIQLKKACVCEGGSVIAEMVSTLEGVGGFNDNEDDTVYVEPI